MLAGASLAQMKSFISAREAVLRAAAAYGARLQRCCMSISSRACGPDVRAGVQCAAHGRGQQTTRHQAVARGAPPAGLEPAIFGLEVRRLVH